MRHFDVVQRFPVSLDRDDNWLVGLVLGVTAIHLLESWRLIAKYERPPMTPDAGIFQHLGWLLTQGGRLYVDAWDPKLPLVFETTAGLAVLSGGNMYLYHLLNVGLILVAAVGSFYLVVVLTHRVTDDRPASGLAGASLFLLPGYIVRPAYGFKAKYLVLFAGLLAVYLALEERPFWSGAAAMASFGYWQLAVVFPITVFAMAFQRQGRRAVAAVVAGGVAVALVMFVPVVLLWDSTSQMLAQTVVIPLLVGDEAPLGTKLVAGVVHFKWASPFVVVGVYGLYRGSRNRWREHWWLPVCATWFGLALFLFDFDTGGYTDLIVGLAFVAIGVGLFAHSLSERRHRLGVGGAVAVVLAVNLVSFGAAGVAFTPVDTPEPVSMAELESNDRAVETAAVPDGTHDVRYLYWNRETPATCHYRLSLNEIEWLEQVGPRAGSECSDLSEVRSVV